MTLPSSLYCEPWHGHLNLFSACGKRWRVSADARKSWRACTAQAACARLVPRHDAAQVSAHSVQAKVGERAVVLDDQVGGIALHTTGSSQQAAGGGATGRRWASRFAPAARAARGAAFSAWQAGRAAGHARAVGVACAVPALRRARVVRAPGPAGAPGHQACLEALRQLAVARQVRREPLLRLDRVTVGVLGRLAAAAAAGPARRNRCVRPRPGAARAGAGRVAAAQAAQVRLAQPWPVRGARTRAARRSRQSRPPAAGPAGRWRPPAAGS